VSGPGGAGDVAGRGRRELHARGSSGAAAAPRPRVGRAGRAALAAASGSLYYAAFPPVGASLLAFVALVPLILAVAAPGGASKSPPSRLTSCLLGWLCCTVAGTLLVGGSVYEAAVRYFDLPPTLAAAAAIAVPQLYGSPFFALFALLAREIVARGHRSAVAAFALAAAWTASELLRSTVGDGVPWLLLAHSQVARPWILQTADLAGAYGPSFLVALVNAAIALAILEPGHDRGGARAARAPERGAWPRGPRARLAATVGLVLAAAAAYGRAQLAHWSASGGEPVRVALIQGNLPDTWRYSIAALPDALRSMADLTRRAADSEPDLVVWPENAVSISVDTNAGAFSALTSALRPGARLLIGAPRAAVTGPGRAALRNSAFLLAGDGAVLGVYDKRRLTPWAETAPWPFSGLPGLKPPPAPSAYSPGAEPTLLDVRGHPFGTLICSEAIYPDLARASVRRGAEMLVVIGNDGWFGARPAGAQHLDAVILRAVETRRPVVRTTTTGITAIIDPRGLVLARAPQNEAATLVGDVRPVPAGVTSVYTRFGDAFAWGCAVFALVAAVWPPRALAEDST
jgi:apolipoprotein N-acyltransferase